MKIIERIENSPYSDRDNDQRKLLTYFRDYGENFQYISVEHYDRCSFRCVYCITESQGKTRPMFSSDPDQLEAQFVKELDMLNVGKGLVVCVCAASDPYNELEAELHLTRRLIEVMKARGIRFTVTTKGPWILDDLDLYKSIDPDLWYTILFSFSSFDQEKANKVERYAPPVADRIDALCTMYREGIPRVGAFIAPWIPDITNTEEILERLPEGILVSLQPMEMGDDFEEPLDQKAIQFSSKASLGRVWSSYELNREYVAECNRLYDRYIKKFPQMEWRWPIYKNTHHNHRGYFRQLKGNQFQPGYFGSEQFFKDFPLKNQT